MLRRRNVLNLLVSHNNKINNNHHCNCHSRIFCCSEEPTPPSSLYSFLQPCIFSLPQPCFSSSPSPPQIHHQTLTQHHHQTTIQSSLSSGNTDAAWKAFKTLLLLLTNNNSSFLPSKPLTNSLISHLSSLHDTLNLKRAFAVSLFFLKRNPYFLEFETVKTLLESMRVVNTPSPAFALVNCMFSNRFFAPFRVWGDPLIHLARKNTGFFGEFLKVFNKNWRVLLYEEIEFMRPGLAAFNAALEGCCCHLESVVNAESVVEKMAVLGVRPDESTFGFLAYLYALKGVKEKVVELEGLMTKLGFINRGLFLRNLVSGYVKSGDLESVSDTILGNLRDNEGSCFSEETFCELVRGFTLNGTIKDLANLISEAQKLENRSVVEKSIGYGVINACIGLGFLDKAHNVLDEMNTKGCSIGLGVYIPILKAYCKEQRTTEATQLVMEISNSGLELDVYTYDALIEAAMAGQDFQSAFSLFRDMREARVADLKASYLTIMTGLTENHRPELMAAFLDEVVDDPRIEIGTHDWNSILHAFCKAGRLEDARRTFRRMLFLQFKPNPQTYLSLINGYANTEKYFSVLILWYEVKKRLSIDGEKRFTLDNILVDAFLYALVKGGYFDAVMQVVEKSQEMKIFVDKWRYKQAFMEKHKKLKVPKLRRRNFKKMEALVAFKNWAGLST